MPFIIDRALQRAVLERLRNAYPDGIDRGPLTDIAPGVEEDLLIGTLMYLEQHGLCDSGLSSPINGNWAWNGSTITARGLDFLADDGGLSAILGVVTVKLHADTIRDLITAKIEASALPAEKKAGLKAALGKLSSTALQAGVTDLAKVGLEHGPDAMNWIDRLVGLMG